MQQAESAHSAPGTCASSRIVNQPSATTRRGLIGLVAAASAFSVAMPVLAASTSSLEAHWSEVKAGYAAMKASTSDDDAPIWARIDAASQAIHRGRARTAREAEVCLWCGLLHNGLTDPRMEEMILAENIRDLSAAANEMRLDYEYLFFVRSLEGLRHAQRRERWS
jgi:hypothetical protein